LDAGNAREMKQKRNKLNSSEQYCCRQLISCSRYYSLKIKVRVIKVQLPVDLHFEHVLKSKFKTVSAHLGENTQEVTPGLYGTEQQH
jgi:hypothetical protein